MGAFATLVVMFIVKEMIHLRSMLVSCFFSNVLADTLFVVAVERYCGLVDWGKGKDV